MIVVMVLVFAAGFVTGSIAMQKRSRLERRTGLDFADCASEPLVSEHDTSYTGAPADYDG